MRIILYDPLSAYRALAEDFLRWIGHQPTCAATPTEFFAAYDHVPTDVLLLALDEGDGTTGHVLDWLEERGCRLPIYVVSDDDIALDRFRREDQRTRPSLRIIVREKPWTAETFKCLCRTADTLLARRYEREERPHRTVAMPDSDLPTGGSIEKFDSDAQSKTHKRF